MPAFVLGAILLQLVATVAGGLAGRALVLRRPDPRPGGDAAGGVTAVPRLPEVAATGPSALRGAATRLAVYGTLAPGGRHHALVANLVGT